MKAITPKVGVFSVVIAVAVGQVVTVGAARFTTTLAVPLTAL